MDLSINRVLSYIEYRRHQRVRLAPGYHAPLLELLALLAPGKAAGLSKIRVGAARDGGYVMLDDLGPIETALSLGIGPDVSWDYDVAERGIFVRQYDPTISALPREHPLFRFEPKRIVGRSASPHDLTFTALMQTVAGKPCVLKMDIEGDEWDVLAHLTPGLLGACRQIVVELHDFIFVEKPAWRDRARKALLLLTRDFGVVHVHGNNLSKHIIADDLILPDSLEVTFANRQFYQLEPTEEIFPGPCDKKNNPYFPDFNLGRFRFQHAGEKT